jgi:hypothetical protein
MSCTDEVNEWGKLKSGVGSMRGVRVNLFHLIRQSIRILCEVNALISYKQWSSCDLKISFIVVTTTACSVY